jgi:RHS repeat-associated protein
MTERDVGGTPYLLDYTAENKLSSVTQGGTTLVSYTYDGDGNLVKKVTPDATTYYVNEMYEVRDPAAGGMAMTMSEPFVELTEVVTSSTLTSSGEIAVSDLDSSTTATTLSFQVYPPPIESEPPYTAGTSNTVYYGDGGGPRTLYSSYQVRRASNAACTSGVVDTSWTSNTSYTFSGLSHNVRYYYCVRGIYALGGEVTDWSSSTYSTQDAVAPSAQMGALPSNQASIAFTVSWGGSDDGSGVKDYTVQVQVDGGTWQTWKSNTTATSATYSGDYGHTYGFRVRSRDQANNLSSWSATVSTSTPSTIITKYYHLGGQRVAMREGGILTYLHTDHLGSASLATDATGGVTSEMRYYPYGETRSGTMDTDRRYTGQRWEAGIGLYDYNARYYDPALGRFVQADTIIPNFANPQSLNRYTYVYNRSLVFADQSGHFPWPLVGVVVGGVIVGGVVGVIVTPEVLPWNPPVVFTDRVAEPITSSDMTGWLRNQMVSNAQSDVVQAIRENWTSHNIVRKDAAMQAWTALVGTGAIWDFKVDIEETSWFENGIRNVTLGNQALNFDAVANMHFGFVGRAAGFDADLLVAAAGFAQAKRALETNDPNDWGACDMSHYCDHPFATWSIEFGIYLYDLYQYRLNELDDAAFASALEEYIQKYGEPPSPPPGAISP